MTIMKRQIAGPEDFVGLLPGLFFSDLTGGGALRFNQRNIGVFPRGRVPEEAEAIVFAGSRVSFNYASPGIDERAKYGGIITSVEITRDSVYTHPNRNALKEFLDNPDLGVKRGYKEMFDKGVLLGGEKLRVLAPLKGDNMGGDAKPYWDSFNGQILKPLKRVLWPI